MKANAGPVDRTLRILVGLAVLSLTVLGPGRPGGCWASCRC